MLDENEEEEAEEGGVYENETRPEKMVSLKDGKITVRMATFLKPIAKDVEQAAEIPRNTPLLSEILPLDQQNWSSNVIFKGWKDPQKRWKEWVDRLAPKYAPIWTKAGIFDSIISSTFIVKQNQELLLGLSEYWCPETNTFVFHWGEATITLEDVMILGGYSVHGESLITPPQTQEMIEIEAKLRIYRTQFNRTTANKVCQGSWIKFFMENETEYEHAAFLSLWLSRFVFPSVSEIVTGDALPIAVKLSLGIRVALAPPVLASLYKDLRKLSEDTMASSQKIVVLAPFQLLQVWAFERFPILAPKSPNPIQPGEPRMARWNKLNLKLDMPVVRSSFELVKNFQWRPYVANVKNWEHPSYIQETDQLVSDITSVNEDDGLLSFLKIVQASRLVGLNCRERYSPHCVAMQFGMDQDIPGELDMLQTNGEVVDFYIPPKTFQPGVTERYSNWWKDMLVARKNAMKQLLLSKKYLLNCPQPKNGDTEDCSVGSQIDCRKRKALDLSDGVKSCIPQPDASTHSKKSNKASTPSIIEDSNQPITLSPSEDSDDDDHLPISTLLQKSSHHETSAVASQTSNIRKGKLSLSHKEENSQKKVNCCEKLSSDKETGQVLEPLIKPLDMNTDNGSERRSEEDETRSIKGTKEYVIAISESEIESRASENNQDYHTTGAAVDPMDPESESSMDSSFQNQPRKVSPTVTFEEKTRADNDNATRKERNKADAGRCQTDFPTTPTILKGSSCRSISPPPGFERLSSIARKRLHEFSNNEGHEPVSPPCDKKVKKELPASVQAERFKTEISNVNSVKMEYISDDDDDTISVSSRRQAVEKRLHNAEKTLKAFGILV